MASESWPFSGTSGNKQQRRCSNLYRLVAGIRAEEINAHRTSPRLGECPSTGVFPTSPLPPHSQSTGVVPALQAR